MSPESIVHSLTNDHKEIIDLFNNVNRAGINTSEGKRYLTSAKVKLTEHLRKEDVDVYGSLLVTANKNPHVKAIVREFAQEMTGITARVLEFFDRYMNGEASSGVEFAMSFGRLVGTIKSRMRKEESILYEEFKKIKSSGY